MNVWVSANWGKNQRLPRTRGNLRAHETALSSLLLHPGFPLTSSFSLTISSLLLNLPTEFLFFSYCIFQYSFKNLPGFTL